MSEEQMNKPFRLTTEMQEEMVKDLAEAPPADDQAVPEDPINPSYYRSHPSGVECIDVVEHMTFNLGTAYAYIWRAGKKGDIIEDLKKAQWYLDREILRLTRDRESGL
jgi:hypothetical protein